MIHWEGELSQNENRKAYFSRLRKVKSPLLQLPTFILNNLIDLRNKDLSATLPVYNEVCNYLQQADTAESKSRAEFIRLQCSGKPDKDFFVSHCESWGIPIFKEEILTVDDFKFGFLWRFRDHTTAWSEDQEAREWFYTNIEAQLATEWQFIQEENEEEDEKVIYTEFGSYKQIITTLANKHSEFEVLKNGLFTQTELQNFLDNYKGNEFSKEELIENFLGWNPNWPI